MYVAGEPYPQTQTRRPTTNFARQFSRYARPGYHVAMLKDRVALITGAATGIGEAVARLFASHGAHTYILDRASAGCHRVAGSIVSAGGSAIACGGDVQRPGDIAPWVEGAIRDFGRIDVLIKNAGIYPRQAFL